MRRISIALFVLVLFIAAAFIEKEHDVASIKKDPDFNIKDTKMTVLTNKYRESKGLEPLKQNAKLFTSAQEKADTLCRTNEWSHSAGGEKFTKSINRAGYDYSKVAENLAASYDDAQGSFNGLLNSPSHHAAIVGDYQDVGVGFSKCGGINYYVIHYGKKEGENQ